MTACLCDTTPPDADGNCDLIENPACPIHGTTCPTCQASVTLPGPLADFKADLWLRDHVCGQESRLSLEPWVEERV